MFPVFELVLLYGKSNTRWKYIRSSTLLKMIHGTGETLEYHLSLNSRLRYYPLFNRKGISANMHKSLTCNLLIFPPDFTGEKLFQKSGSKRPTARYHYQRTEEISVAVNLFMMGVNTDYLVKDDSTKDLFMECSKQDPGKW